MKQKPCQHCGRDLNKTRYLVDVGVIFGGANVTKTAAFLYGYRRLCRYCFPKFRKMILEFFA